MVLESLITPREVRKNSWYLFFLGIIFSSSGIILSIFVFPGNAGIFSVFLTTLAAAPLFILLLQEEELLSIRLIEKKQPIFKNNIDIISAFFFLFLGFTISCILWFCFLPEGTFNLAFNEQLNEISSIQSIATGNIASPGLFETVLKNNLRVLFFCMLFSLIYGAGAVLILAWNASVLGTAVGLFIREKMASDSSMVAVFLSNLPFGLGQYMFHGAFELTAYFIGSLIGGILSASIVRKSFTNRNFFKLFKNIIFLLLISIALIFIAAIIEVNL
ncbi:MAG: stage II sporulation protein M [Candidatus Nanoarchaeia archaeon]|nr:stage II sporulation protein M [Candidatus Nanoarchaeia archaeon]MDD5053839.1 stage II sporulation protein M [Candidatus Nanoarchaeia archaeon]MDD5499654.1 stage II sporulation protein M [Candidatus Nanoarchaeia archaeon]